MVGTALVPTQGTRMDISSGPLWCSHSYLLTASLRQVSNSFSEMRKAGLGTDRTCCLLTNHPRIHTQVYGSEVHEEGRCLHLVCWFMSVQCSREAELRPQIMELDCQG